MGRQRVDALAIAGRALESRDLSVAALARKLRRAGVGEREIEEAISHLRSAGYLDDERVACERARRLAERGYGDASIDAKLELEGIGRELRIEALAQLDPEPVRAARVAGGADSRRMAATLSRRGFSEDAIEIALARLDGHAGAELR